MPGPRLPAHTAAHDGKGSAHADVRARSLPLRLRGGVVPKLPPQPLIHFDAAVGILYSLHFLFAPLHAMRCYFRYDLEESDLRKLLALAVRTVAVNHLGYVAGLLVAPPSQAIRVATGFLGVGGAAVVGFGQAFLATKPAHIACSALTLSMFVAHLFAW